VALGEVGQYGHRIVADCEDGNALSLEVRHALLQLHELRLTVGSPAGAAIEEDQGAPAGPDLVEIDGVAVLVGQYDVRESGADRGADPGEVDPRQSW
jgi:hypothetical protein